MSDDNDSRGRPPRRGGGAGGRGRDGGGRSGGGPRPPRAGGGERRPFRGHSDDAGGSAPKRSFRPRDGEAGGERPKRPFVRREDGDRPRGAAGDRPKRPFQRREDGERPPRRDDRGERPQRREGGAPRRFEGERGASRPPARPRRNEGEAVRDKRPLEDAAPSAAPTEPERIAKVMARAGVASRRDAEAMIAEGRVSVNGKVIDSPALDVGPADVVEVDGEPLPERERTRLWLYHKPRGLVTTNHDPEGRPTVFDALPEDLPRVLSIGRLDINTEGLLLLTNDGGLARLLELPATGWLRRYRVRAFGSITQDRLDTLRDGVTIEGVEYGPVVARFEREQGSNTWLTVDLREGKNREVKTVLEHLGLAVNRLIRISFGPFQLGDLPEAEIDEVRSRVLRDQLGPELMAQAGVDLDGPRRDQPIAQRRSVAPAADDRPRRRSTREDAAPSRSDPRERRNVWRDVEAEPQRGRKAPPRRGADPRLEREAREAAGTVERKRQAPIAGPRGNRVLVERVAAPKREEAPRAERPERKDRRFDPAERTDGDRPRRGPPRGERPMRDDGERAPRRSAPRFEDRGGDERPRRGPPRQDGERREGGRSNFARAMAGRGGGSRDGESRPQRGGFRGEREGGEGRAPRGSKPGFGRSEGGREGRSFGGKPGGRFGGGKPGGDRPGRGGPGGKPGGRPGGGRPGGGGRPAGGGRGRG